MILTILVIFKYEVVSIRLRAFKMQWRFYVKIINIEICF